MSEQQYANLHPIIAAMVAGKTVRDRAEVFPRRLPKPGATVTSYATVRVQLKDRPGARVREVFTFVTLSNLWVVLPGGRVEARVDPRTPEGREVLDRYRIVD